MVKGPYIEEYVDAWEGRKHGESVNVREAEAELWCGRMLCGGRRERRWKPGLWMCA